MPDKYPCIDSIVSGVVELGRNVTVELRSSIVHELIASEVY